MKLSKKAQTLHSQINKAGTKMSDLRKIAKEIKKDHGLAMELWSTGEFMSRKLALLIMDKTLLTKEVVDRLMGDMQKHDEKERSGLSDWLLANQLTKDKKAMELIEVWEDSPLAVQRRLFWYHQARKRWVGQTPPDDTEKLLASAEKKLMKEPPEVQMMMNFLVGWVGVYDETYRKRCAALGEKTGLYKDQVVPKGCTPGYLPEFIRVEVAKRSK